MGRYLVKKRLWPIMYHLKNFVFWILHAACFMLVSVFAYSLTVMLEVKSSSEKLVDF
jgi:hypothetical protein